MGYHIAKIEKGVYGEWSKVQEEIDEIIDSLDQNLKPMLLIELCDCLGALKGYYNAMGYTDFDSLLINRSKISRIFNNPYLSCDGKYDVMAEQFKFDLRNARQIENVGMLAGYLINFTASYFNNSITFVDLIKFSNKTSEVRESETKNSKMRSFHYYEIS